MAHTANNKNTIALVISRGHEIHDVRDSGYLERPARIGRIAEKILPLDIFREIPCKAFPESRITAVHGKAMVGYMKKTCAVCTPGEHVYPYIIPLRNKEKPPADLTMGAGYYCIDTFTPLHRNAFIAAKEAADCALTAADAVRRGFRSAYALIRPPGHHAEKNAYGGFCYFNSTAIAAQHLSSFGKTAVLDLDYHHGNGTQNIFYERRDVLTISIHGHPKFAYPYFTGFTDERGAGPGRGCNINYPLQEHIDGAKYRKALGRALADIGRFGPSFLLVALGFDTARNDPTGSWSLLPEDFYRNGVAIGGLHLPTLFVQEGGYLLHRLGINAKNFFKGFHDGSFGGAPVSRKTPSSLRQKEGRP